MFHENKDMSRNTKYTHVENTHKKEVSCYPEGTKHHIPTNGQAYTICLQGKLVKRKCKYGMIFDIKKHKCVLRNIIDETVQDSGDSSDDNEDYDDDSVGDGFEDGDYGRTDNNANSHVVKNHPKQSKGKTLTNTINIIVDNRGW